MPTIAFARRTLPIYRHVDIECALPSPNPFPLPLQSRHLPHPRRKLSRCPSTILRLSSRSLCLLSFSRALSPSLLPPSPFIAQNTLIDNNISINHHGDRSDSTNGEFHLARGPRKGQRNSRQGMYIYINCRVRLCFVSFLDFSSLLKTAILSHDSLITTI
jgi:hypothetical protein